jgi:hypothetical protein
MTQYYKFRHDGSEAGQTEPNAVALQTLLPAKP